MGSVLLLRARRGCNCFQLLGQLAPNSYGRTSSPSQHSQGPAAHSGDAADRGASSLIYYSFLSTSGAGGRAPEVESLTAEDRKAQPCRKSRTTGMQVSQGDEEES